MNKPFSLTAPALSLLLLAACGDEEDASADAAQDAAEDARSDADADTGADTVDHDADAADTGADAEDGDETTDTVDGDAGDVASDGSGDTADTGDDVATDTGEPGRPCAESGISKGPWVLGIDSDSALVRWEACREGTDATLLLTVEGHTEASPHEATPWEYEVTDTVPALPPAVPVDYNGTWWMHDARLEGLAAGTCYTYALEADDTARGRFCTERASGDDFSFMAVGDTNPAISPQILRLLDTVLPPEGPENPDFTLHGGDIQYYSSLMETWASWFPMMAPMLRQGGFFPASGNHERERANEFTEYYTRFFGGGGYDGDNRWYSFSSGGVFFFSLDTEEPFGRETEQGEWLEAALADAAAADGHRLSVVYLHRPFFTCGDSDHHPTEQAEWEPVFQEHGVRLVVQAHMHGYERFEKDGITYVTSGGGGGLIGPIDASIDRAECVYRVEAGAWVHVMMFDVDADGEATTLNGRAIDADGTARDSFAITLPAR